MKIQVWATTENGDGFVQSLGIYDSIEDIDIRIGMFSDDILITFEYVIEEENK